MKRFSHGVIPGHNVAIGPQPQDDGPFCLYEDHLKAVAEAVREFIDWLPTKDARMLHDYVRRIGEPTPFNTVAEWRRELHDLADRHRRNKALPPPSAPG